LATSSPRRWRPAPQVRPRPRSAAPAKRRPVLARFAVAQNHAPGRNPTPRALRRWSGAFEGLQDKRVVTPWVPPSPWGHPLRTQPTIREERSMASAACRARATLTWRWLCGAQREVETRTWRRKRRKGITTWIPRWRQSTAASGGCSRGTSRASCRRRSKSCPRSPIGSRSCGSPNRIAGATTPTMRAPASLPRACRSARRSARSVGGGAAAEG